MNNSSINFIFNQEPAIKTIKKKMIKKQYFAPESNTSIASDIVKINTIFSRIQSSSFRGLDPEIKENLLYCMNKLKFMLLEKKCKIFNVSKKQSLSKNSSYISNQCSFRFKKTETQSQQQETPNIKTYTQLSKSVVIRKRKPIEFGQQIISDKQNIRSTQIKLKKIVNNEKVDIAHNTQFKVRMVESKQIITKLKIELQNKNQQIKQLRDSIDSLLILTNKDKETEIISQLKKQPKKLSFYKWGSYILPSYPTETINHTKQLKLDIQSKQKEQQLQHLQYMLVAKQKQIESLQHKLIAQQIMRANDKKKLNY